MANIQSQIKRIRTNEKRNEINKSYKSQIKTIYNKATLAINTNADNAQALVNDFCSKIDKAVSKGIFHTNKAANKKAKIMKSLHNTKNSK